MCPSLKVGAQLPELEPAKAGLTAAHLAVVPTPESHAAGLEVLAPQHLAWVHDTHELAERSRCAEQHSWLVLQRPHEVEGQLQMCLNAQASCCASVPVGSQAAVHLVQPPEHGTGCCSGNPV